MAVTRTAPYTLTKFCAVPDGTVFVNAGEYANTQDELPLGLKWETVYQSIINPDSWKRSYYEKLGYPYASLAQAVKYHGWGYHLNASGASNHYPDDPIITGPELKDLPRFGGPLTREEAEIIHYLQRLEPRWTMLRDFDFAGSRWSLSSLLKRLDRVGFVELARDRVCLSNLGLLRTLQEQNASGVL